MVPWDYREDKPRVGESVGHYAARIENAGKREIELRKALHFHFQKTLPEAVETCGSFEQARLREILILRDKFPNLGRDQLISRIGRTMSVSSEEAALWADRVLGNEALEGKDG